MGRRIKKISVSSWRSLLSLYGKVATLLFALFCTASGQTVKTLSVGAPADSTKTFKGFAFFASDSTALKNVRLYLCMLGPVPVYGVGMGFNPYRKTDSTTSDNKGYAQIDSVPMANRYGMALMTDRMVNGKDTTVFVSQTVFFPEGKDTTFTLYLTPFIPPVSVVPTPNRSPVTQLSITQGKNVTVKIPELASAIKSVSVINIKGEFITTLHADAGGTIHWNTQSTAKGIYFLSIKSGLKNMNVKIVVQ